MVPLGRSVVRRLTPSGLVIAALGFFLTRFTVTLVLGNDSARFLFVGLGPLVVGLSVAVVGVVLAIGAFHPRYVRTVALWTVLGTGSMTLLVALTLYGQSPAELSMSAVRGDASLSNVMIGGCAGGMLTGVYAARNERRRRAERAQARRLAVLNHLFRDAALNAITAIRGRLEVVSSGDEETRAAAMAAIDDRTADLEDDVEEFRRLTRGASVGATRLEPVALVSRIEACVAEASVRFPGASISLTSGPPVAHVWATETLQDALGMVIESAVERHPEGAPRIEIRIESVGGRYRIAIADDGPPLSVTQRRLLADESDDATVNPTGGFGLPVAELLVESYRGEFAATAAGDGTTVTIELSGAKAATAGERSAVAGTPSGGVARDRLALVAAAAVVAGVVMGLAMDTLAGAIPVIGTLYGVADPLVGWTTHLFHSLVFGFIYAGVLAVAPARLDAGHAHRVGVALAWGVVLALVAAGVIMPVWLQLVGVPATVPMWQANALFTHLLWGGVLGVAYSVGSEHLAARAEDRAVVDGANPPA